MSSRQSPEFNGSLVGNALDDPLVLKQGATQIDTLRSYSRGGYAVPWLGGLSSPYRWWEYFLRVCLPHLNRGN